MGTQTATQSRDVAQLKKEREGIISHAASVMKLDRKVLESAEVVVGYVKEIEGDRTCIHLDGAGDGVKRVASSTGLRRYIPNLRVGDLVALIVYQREGKRTSAYILAPTSFRGAKR